MLCRTRAAVLSLAVILLASACGSSTVTTSPSASGRATSPSAPSPAATSSATAPTPSGDPLVVGSLATTVSDRLRVRSEPRVSDDSIMHEPVLPIGTELTVVGGPVSASDYVWYQVELAPGTLADGITRGWVAIADHDGTPWVALAGPPIAGLEVAVSDVARAPSHPAAGREAAASVNAFAVDVYRELARNPELATSNTVFSPASIALALGMARGGARGDTAAEMDDVLHTTGWDELAPGLNALSQALASRNERWVDYDDAPREVALRIANAAFAQRGWTVEPAFLDAIAVAFGAGVNLVDYIADHEAARRVINAWVERETEGRIPELLAPPDVTASTRLYLVNAIYLKAEWDEWFSESETRPRPFTRPDGSTVDVPTMQTHRGFGAAISPYVRGDGWRATELRYRTSGPDAPPLAMTLIRPDDMTAFEADLSAATMRSIVGALDRELAAWQDVDCPDEYQGGCYPYDLALFMPKFGIETRVDLAPFLGALGMSTAFDPATADFTGIHVPEGSGDAIYISAVIHQANIDVDEKGTEAAAATAVGFDTGGGPSPLKDITLRLDRPFLFLLRDVETGAILFMGRVLDPSVGR